MAYNTAMKRRAFIPLALAPTLAFAQPRMAVVGVLDPGDPAEFLQEFRKALNGLGHVEGKNLRLEIRSGHDNADTLARGAEELVRAKVDVIAVRLTPALRAAMHATRQIPIVMAAVGAPVETGLVASLARPGGNVTGMSLGGATLAAKRLQIIREVVPSIRRLASLVNAHEPYSEIVASTFEQAGKPLGLQTVSIRTTAETLGAGLAQLESARPDAIHTLASLPIEPVVAAALRLRVPLFATQRSAVEAGALMSYGGRLDEQFEGAAFYVDKILKGAKPTSLPVEEPSRFELVINMKTAKALGLTISRTLLAQADMAIE
jgi:putative tryptophan/tyrosine transport system substrate-binding protein